MCSNYWSSTLYLFDRFLGKFKSLCNFCNFCNLNRQIYLARLSSFNNFIRFCSVCAMELRWDRSLRSVRTGVRRYMRHPTIPRLLLQQYAEETFRFLRPEILDETAKIRAPPLPDLRRLIIAPFTSHTIMENPTI